MVSFLLISRISLKAKIEQHIGLIQQETPQVALKDIPLVQRKLLDLKSILATMTELRQSFHGERGRLMEAGNRYLLMHLCEAAHAVNDRHLLLMPKPRKTIYRKQVVAPLTNNSVFSPSPFHDMPVEHQLLTTQTVDDSHVQDVQAMYASMQSVHTLYSEIQNLVLHQGHQIEHIMTNLENAAIHTELGTQQVHIRVQRERVNTKILLLFSVVAIIFLTTIGLILTTKK